MPFHEFALLLAGNRGFGFRRADFQRRVSGLLFTPLCTLGSALSGDVPPGQIEFVHLLLQLLE